MKKIFLLAVLCLLNVFAGDACEKDGPQNHFQAFRAGQQFPEFHPRIFVMQENLFYPEFSLYAVRGINSAPSFFSVSKIYFQPFSGSVYEEFSMFHYEFPGASVFCRMENETCNRYGFMFSIHAGSAR